MAIIYPPFIGEKIPGFIQSTIKIPFVMNPGVDEQEIEGFSLQIKNYRKSDIIKILQVENTAQNVIWETDDHKSGTVTFTTDSSFTPTLLQYYKFQLGYISNYSARASETIAYSVASIGKCIGSTAPTIGLTDSPNGNIWDHSNYYNRGTYYARITNLDSSEKVYSYKFVLRKNNEIIEVFETFENINNYAKYRLKTEINSNDNFSLEIIITTINGYQNNKIYTIVNEDSSLPLLDDAEIQIKTIDNDYVEINIIDNDGTGTRNYLLERLNEDNNIYEQLAIVNLSENQTIQQKDYAIEQGIKYSYTIRKLNEYEVFTSQRKHHVLKDNTSLMTPISLDYEDILLLGINGKGLKIKFDPKISSFKNTILESKTDTIGNKYPFFFRNGNVNYKEIPISGLISYHMDNDNKQFMTNLELGLENSNTQLTEENIMVERKFRLAVLDWLTNGEPKLFRSATEGVYVIRLMNISLSPNDTLGRMIYSFSATGYEVADHDIETLLKEKLVNYNGEASSRLGYFILGISRLGGST